MDLAALQNSYDLFSKAQGDSSSASIFAFAPGQSFMDLLNENSSISAGYEPDVDLYSTRDNSFELQQKRDELRKQSVSDFLGENDIDDEKLGDELVTYLEENPDLDDEIKEKIQKLADHLRTDEPQTIDTGEKIELISTLGLINTLGIGNENLSEISKLNEKINNLLAESVIRIDQNGVVTIPEDKNKDKTQLSDQELNDFKDFMAHLLRGIPKETRPQMAQIPQELIARATAHLNSAKHSKDGNPEIIATDLNPEQLSAMLDNLQKKAESGDPIIVGLIKMTPPSSDEAPVFIPQAIILPHHLKQQLSAQNNQKTVNAATPAQGITDKAQLNGLTQTLSNANTAPSGEMKISDEPARNAPQNAQSSLPAQTGNAQSGYDRILQLMEQTQGGQRHAGNQNATASTQIDRLGSTASALANAANTTNSVNNAAPQSAANQASAVSIALSASGSMMTDPAAFNGLNTDSLTGLQTQGIGAITTTLGSTAQLASAITQGSNAAQPHPSTQSLAVKLSKAASSGGTQKNLSIKMDPPELGKVSIDIEMNTDAKKIKAHLVVEKPETLAMLQRDSHTLEKALQNSGFDSADADVSFELADDGNNTFSEGQKESQHAANKGSKGNDGEDEDIIETTMEWQVDPQTGLTRYDILV